MSSILTIVILLTTTTSIAIGLAGLIVGVGGRSWLKSPLFDYGLWSVDILGVTLRRNNILEFKISYGNKTFYLRLRIYMIKKIISKTFFFKVQQLYFSTYNYKLRRQ